jgi:hypothetical protein
VGGVRGVGWHGGRPAAGFPRGLPERNKGRDRADGSAQVPSALRSDRRASGGR